MAAASFADADTAAQNVTVKFLVPYDTKWGENLVVVGSRGLLGSGDVSKGVSMACAQGARGLVWQASVGVPAGYECTYKYVVWDDHRGELVAEECAPHALSVSRVLAGACVLLADQFQAHGNIEKLYASAAFRDVIFSARPRVRTPAPRLIAGDVGTVLVRFSITDYTLPVGKALYVYGSIAELGTWQEARAVALTEVETPLWQADVSVAISAFPFTYRHAPPRRPFDTYVILDADTERAEIAGDAGAGDTGAHEDGEARTAMLEPLSLPDATETSGRHAVTGPWPQVLQLNDGHFQHRRRWKGSGLALPVFSLRTRQSVGCGDFADLKVMADFVAATGMHVLQVLPVNDTCSHSMWWDSYPYSAISVFALHPLYVCLPAIAASAAGTDAELDARVAAAIATARARPLPAETRAIDMDYEATLADKLTVARMLFDGGQGDRDLESEEFKAWRASSASWLHPYATFCFLRDLFGTADHLQWGALHADAPATVARLCDERQPFYRELHFTMWLQWHLHLQLADAAAHARARHVVLKGDLPIGVAKGGVDTWMSPSLFRMDVSVGSPPDGFDPNGQNWGFPGYNWEEMARDGYAWWRARLCHMAQYFTAYRVDHILGFFRVYEVPVRHVGGALGHFRPSAPPRRVGLTNAGLWDLDRLTEPWITDELLEEELEEADVPDVVGRFLEPHSSEEGRYRFRAVYASERALEAAVVPPPDSPTWLIEKQERIRRVLRRLLAGVILLRDDHDPSAFHPRFRLMDTPSFAALDPSSHSVLRAIHDGYFYSNHNALWAACARRTLPALMRATDMLICGEDLGFVPECVPPVMHELGILGLRVQRMPGFDSPAGAEFADPSHYSYWSVASPSSHDTTPVRAWFDADEARRERFFYSALDGRGELPARCTPEVMSRVALQHLASPAVLTILPLQDWLALSPAYYGRPAAEETINDPTNPRHYWRWRMAPTVEDLLEDRDLVTIIRNIHFASGRASPEDLLAAALPPPP